MRSVALLSLVAGAAAFSSLTLKCPAALPQVECILESVDLILQGHGSFGVQCIIDVCSVQPIEQCVLACVSEYIIDKLQPIEAPVGD